MQARALVAARRVLQFSIVPAGSHLEHLQSSTRPDEHIVFRRRDFTPAVLQGQAPSCGVRDSVHTPRSASVDHAHEHEQEHDHDHDHEHEHEHSMPVHIPMSAPASIGSSPRLLGSRNVDLCVINDFRRCTQLGASTTSDTAQTVQIASGYYGGAQGWNDIVTVTLRCQINFYAVDGFSAPTMSGAPRITPRGIAWSGAAIHAQLAIARPWAPRPQKGGGPRSSTSPRHHAPIALQWRIVTSQSGQVLRFRTPAC